MTSPTPIDGLVWSYHVLGWSTRRIAGEVQTSQATVVRILDRLKKEPPSDMTPPSGLPMLSAADTIPGGIPVIQAEVTTQVAEPEPRPRYRGFWMGATFVLLAIVVLATVLAATGIIIRGVPGQRGVPGPRGDTGPAGKSRTFTMCVRYDPSTGDIANLSAPVDGSCGTATLIHLP